MRPRTLIWKEQPEHLLSHLFGRTYSNVSLLEQTGYKYELRSCIKGATLLMVVFLVLGRQSIKKENKEFTF